MDHESAKSTHYDEDAKNYDIFNEKNSRVINLVIENILRKHGVKTVLDLTCGTGSQVFWLSRSGYQVIGSDFNRAMLEIARVKAKKDNLKVEFFEGDMRNFHAGTFDAAVTIFNAIGHLTREDFEVTLQNVRSNLKQDGLYIFDIFNLEYLLNGDNITKLTIDWLKRERGKSVREIQYSTISREGVLASFTTSITEAGVTSSQQTLQVYSAKELEEMLKRNGFLVVSQREVDGLPLKSHESERILTVARKL